MVSPILGKIRTATRRLSRFIRRRDNEQAYIGHHTASVAASGGTISLHLANPTNDRVIDVHRFLISTQFRGQFWIFDQFDGDVTGGSSVTVQNLHLDEENGSPDSGSMSMASGVTFTESGTHYHEAVEGGGPGGSIGGQSSGTEPLIDPGREIVIQLQNDSGSDRLGTIAVVYTERPQPDVEA